MSRKNSLRGNQVFDSLRSNRVVAFDVSNESSEFACKGTCSQDQAHSAAEHMAKLSKFDDMDRMLMLGAVPCLLASWEYALPDNSGCQQRPGSQDGRIDPAIVRRNQRSLHQE